MILSFKHVDEGYAPPPLSKQSGYNLLWHTSSTVSLNFIFLNFILIFNYQAQNSISLLELVKGCLTFHNKYSNLLNFTDLEIFISKGQHHFIQININNSNQFIITIIQGPILMMLYELHLRSYFVPLSKIFRLKHLN